ncbi:MAG: agmatine deiminase family protein [Ignavibacterium sp.]|jgi:agmatine deiminase|uniref:agmatine deiminase family protein n=1 Tax=Ignavibacterium sp. TaxID=2651167 RepID=UPI00329745AB
MNNKNFYRLPAEWEKHEATWIGWPANKEDWPGKFTPIPWVYGEIVRYISREEKVRIIVSSKLHKQKAINVLKSVDANLSNIEFYFLKTDRNWLRDAGPQFIKDEKGNTLIVQFKFNAWAKYDNYKLDAKIPKMISEKLKLKKVIAEHHNKEVVLEGGSIDYNGTGTIITTEECLMDDEIQVRNPGFTKKDYEEVFKKYFGVTNVIWLGKGIAGDDTHGHVDDITRFVNRNTLVTVIETKANDPNYIPLMENRERLEDATLEDGSAPEIVEIPMPSPVYFKGQRLPASYANFYISNYAVLVPTFNDPNDRIALGILSELFEDRPVIGIHAGDLVWGLGTLHCLTHEQVL